MCIEVSKSSRTCYIRGESPLLSYMSDMYGWILNESEREPIMFRQFMQIRRTYQRHFRVSVPYHVKMLAIMKHFMETKFQFCRNDEELNTQYQKQIAIVPVCEVIHAAAEKKIASMDFGSAGNVVYRTVSEG